MSNCIRPLSRGNYLARIFSGLLMAGLSLPLAAQTDTSTSSPAPPTPPYSATFAMVGFTPGETVRLNVLNIQDAVLPTAAAPCVIQAAFLDTNGHVIKSQSLTVNPG